MDIRGLVSDIDAIKKRNRQREIDKAWEASGTRRMFVSALIYIVSALWLMTLGDSLSLLKAIVPTIGYIFSTMSLPFIKRHWIYATYRRRITRHR